MSKQRILMRLRKERDKLLRLKAKEDKINTEKNRLLAETKKLKMEIKQVRDNLNKGIIRKVKKLVQDPRTRKVGKKALVVSKSILKFASKRLRETDNVATLLFGKPKKRTRKRR